MKASGFIFYFCKGCFPSLEWSFLLAPAQMLGAASMGKDASVPRRPRTGQLGQLLLLASGKASPGGTVLLEVILAPPLRTRFCAEEGEPVARAAGGWTLVRAFRPRDQRHPCSSPSVTRSPYILMKDTNEFCNSLPALPSSLLLLSPLLP